MNQTNLPLADRSLHVDVQYVVDSFSLSVRFSSGGNNIALVGASGAGKTLTLRTIAGLVTPHSGKISLGTSVFYDGISGVNVAPRDRSVGYMFQQYALFPHMSAADNVGYGLRHMTADSREQRVMEMFELVGLSGFNNRHLRSLSGGQQQRLAVARALAPIPKLLLLDEPLSAVDAPLRRRLGENLRLACEKLNVPLVVVTHDIDEAHRMADTIISIDGGTVR